MLSWHQICLIPPNSLHCYSDVNSQVTVLTKTFLRYKELNVLIQSIRMYYPDIMIIIADDSMKPEPVTGKNIEHYIMPPTRVNAFYIVDLHSQKGLDSRSSIFTVVCWYFLPCC